MKCHECRDMSKSHALALVDPPRLVAEVWLLRADLGKTVPCHNTQAR